MGVNEGFFCGDCDRYTLDEHAVTSAVSAVYGPYYSGPPICPDCARDRYEDAAATAEGD